MNDKTIYPVFEDRRFVGRATKDPFFGSGIASVAVAINHSFKVEDGSWKQVDPVYEDVVVFDDENYRFIQDNVHKGTAIEVFGRVQYRERKGYINRNIVVGDRNPEHYIRLATPLERKASSSPPTKGTSARAGAAYTTQRRKPAAVEEDNEPPF